MKETTDYGSRLKALKEEQQRLERKQAELLEKRRAKIGRLVEKLGLLEADDDTLAGALLELKDAAGDHAIPATCGPTGIAVARQTGGAGTRSDSAK